MFICSFFLIKAQKTKLQNILGFVFLSLPTIWLLLSFAYPKESNQRKRQPQIFFGINIFSAAHALQLALRHLADRSNSNAY
jgi:Ca2+/Na+ antiporter